MKYNFKPGETVGHFEYIEEVAKVGEGKKLERAIKVRCKCGNVCIRRLRHAVKNIVVSCGCKWKEVAGNASRTHGEAYKNKTKEYRCWQNMKSRCTPGHRQYKDYGGRGILVCERWNKYENFLEDMGRAPSKQHSIERRKNNEGYNSDNCYWGTKKEQALNRRNVKQYEYKGILKNLEEWSKETGIHRKLLWDRIEGKKWDIERALTTPKETKYLPKV